MSFDEIKTLLIDAGGVGAASLITWLFSSRHRQAQVKKLELENEQTASKIYKELCDELRGEMDELRHRVRQNDARIQQLEAENCELRLQVTELKMNRWG